MWEGLLAFGDIPNERENGKEFLGRNRRPEQTQMLEDLKFALSHVATSQECAIFGESLPRQRRPRPWLRSCSGQENVHFRMGEEQNLLPIKESMTFCGVARTSGTAGGSLAG